MSKAALLSSTTKRHNLDRYADRRIGDAPPGDDDASLTTEQVADWLQVSVQFLEVGRSKHPKGNYGPKYKRVSGSMIRYRKGDVIAWLRSRIVDPAKRRAA